MLTSLLYIVFIISCLLLIVVILIQEGKGGGLGDAFGGVGGETFGHRAGPINKFTSVLAAVMMVSLILLHTTKGEATSAGLFENKPAELMPNPLGTPPGGAPVTPLPGAGTTPPGTEPKDDKK
ncbi:MAG: preprotein translocase subunit SecG [Planctomycetota bacterium]